MRTNNNTLGDGESWKNESDGGVNARAARYSASTARRSTCGATRNTSVPHAEIPTVRQSNGETGRSSPKHQHLRNGHSAASTAASATVHGAGLTSRRSRLLSRSPAPCSPAEQPRPRSSGTPSSCEAPSAGHFTRNAGYAPAQRSRIPAITSRRDTRSAHRSPPTCARAFILRSSNRVEPTGLRW